MSTGTGDEQERGREADAPLEISRAGWRDVLVRLKDAIREDRITLIAAGVAFYAMLALFPAIVVVVSVYGLVMDPEEIAAQVRTLGVLPGDVRSILTAQLDALARASSGRLSLSLAFGVLVALWSASAGMKALVTGVNAAYSEAETRGFVRLRGLAIVLTLGGSLVTVLAMAVIVALPVAAGRLPEPAGLLVSVLRWPLLAGVLIAGLAVLYRVAPSRKDARWQWLSWGSVAATGLLLVGSMLCSLYASFAPAQNKTYGAFFGVMVLLFWLDGDPAGSDAQHPGGEVEVDGQLLQVAVDPLGGFGGDRAAGDQHGMGVVFADRLADLSARPDDLGKPSGGRADRSDVVEEANDSEAEVAGPGHRPAEIAAVAASADDE